MMEENMDWQTLLAYVLVVPLVQFCLTAGVLLGGGLVALLLAWAPISLRTKAAGVCGGILGVTFAVSFGYGIFHFVVGPGSFTIGAFLASTLPLLLPIRNDLLHSRRVKTARDQRLGTIAESRGKHTAAAMATETDTSFGGAVAGEIVGLALAAVWFFWR
jgi:mannose/fructose/N-acetylgalactosamine-specific phosphotransferase system component IIC